MTDSTSPHLPPGRLLFSSAETGKILGVSPWTVQRWCRAGRFGPPDTLMVDGRYRIPRAAILAVAQADEGGAAA